MNRDTSPILLNQGHSNEGFDINESTMTVNNDVHMDRDNFNRFEYRRFCDHVRQIVSMEKIILYSILIIILFCCFVALKMNGFQWFEKKNRNWQVGFLKM